MKITGVLEVEERGEARSDRLRLRKVSRVDETRRLRVIEVENDSRSESEHPADYEITIERIASHFPRLQIVFSTTPEVVSFLRLNDIVKVSTDLQFVVETCLAAEDNKFLASLLFDDLRSRAIVLQLAARTEDRLTVRAAKLTERPRC